MAVSIPARMSSSTSRFGRAVVCMRSRPSSPTRKRSSGFARHGNRFQPTYPTIAIPRIARPVHGLIRADQIDGLYHTVSDMIEGEMLAFPVESVARTAKGFVARPERSCQFETPAQLAPPSTETSYVIEVPGGRVSFTENDCHVKIGSSGRNGAVRRMPASA